MIFFRAKLKRLILTIHLQGIICWNFQQMSLTQMLNAPYYTPPAGSCGRRNTCWRYGFRVRIFGWSETVKRVELLVLLDMENTRAPDPWHFCAPYQTHQKHRVLSWNLILFGVNIKQIIPKNPGMSKERALPPTFLIFSDGIGTLNPILGSGFFGTKNFVGT